MDPWVALVRTAYRFDLTRQQHADALAGAISGKLVTGPGPSAFWTACHAGYARRPPQDVGIEDDDRGVLASALQNLALGRKEIEFFRTAAPGLYSVSQISPDLRSVCARLGIHDFVGLYSPLGSGVGLFLGQQRSIFRPIDRKDAKAWAIVATHISAAWRLRLRLERVAEGVDAVFDTGGRTLHAKGAAAAPTAMLALREAVVRRERAHSNGAGKSAQQRTPLWSPLVAGRWTILDRFDSDGRRFVVAHRNDPDMARVLALDASERKALSLVLRGSANKVVAAELGVSEPTASRVVRQGLRKVGMSCADFFAFMHARPPQRWTISVAHERFGVVELPCGNPEVFVGLTRSERDVVAASLYGASDAQIASSRRRSVRTVQHQLASAFCKLGVHSRRELILRFAQAATEGER